jgi:hypothetical protein
MAISRLTEFGPFTIVNPNKAWCVKEVDKLLYEWRSGNQVVQNLADSPDFNPSTCSEAIKDGRDNLKKHEILREKTLVFLRNNFTGYEFILEKWSTHPHEDVTSRLRRRVPEWVHRLEMLQAALEYARVPDGFWKEKGKELVSAIAKKAPEKAAEIAAAYLKNPMG